MVYNFERSLDMQNKIERDIQKLVQEVEYQAVNTLRIEIDCDGSGVAVFLRDVDCFELRRISLNNLVNSSIRYCKRNEDEHGVAWFKKLRAFLRQNPKP